MKTLEEDTMTSTISTPRATRTREATDRKITQATLDILISDGIGAMTIEEVSRRSGVAKTTIYRRYRNTDDLLHHLQIEAVNLPEFEHLDTTREGLHTLLERVAASFNSEIGLKAVGAVLSTNNQAVHGLARQIIDPAQQRFAQFIARGIASGAFCADCDAHFLFDTVLGSMLAAKALTPDTADAWADRMTALLWPSLAQ